MFKEVIFNDVEFFDDDVVVICQNCGRVHAISELEKDEYGFFICEDCKMPISSVTYKL